MDAVNTERDRDQSVERVLGQALRTGADAEVSGACLDAETLAAWADRGLTASDLAAVETHLSECSRCQSLVATLERTRPASPEREPWWPPNFGFGWLVPVTAAAAAILLWVALPGHEPARSPASLDVQMPAAAPILGTTAPRPQEPPPAEGRQAPAAVREELRAPEAGRAEAKEDVARAAPPGARDASKENRKTEQEPT